MNLTIIIIIITTWSAGFRVTDIADIYNSFCPGSAVWIFYNLLISSPILIIFPSFPFSLIHCIPITVLNISFLIITCQIITLYFFQYLLVTNFIFPLNPLHSFRIHILKFSILTFFRKSAFFSRILQWCTPYIADN